MIYERVRVRHGVEPFLFAKDVEIKKSHQVGNSVTFFSEKTHLATCLFSFIS